MSIYRGNNRLFFNDDGDATQRPAPTEVKAGKAQRLPLGLSLPEVAKLRKANPATMLLPTSRRWLEQLPEELRPNQLARDFPRIVNHLAASWPEPVDFHLYGDRLLVDRRGNRKGFPVAIREELHRLLNYFESLYPRTGNAWEFERPLRSVEI
ncbi:MAG: hypothetical protein ABI881_13095 [Betaproteobacteria bacterium]